MTSSTSTHSGYLLIADISGYTAYMTSSELEHANPILRALLTAMVEQIGEPLKFWRLEGDAVLAYSTHRDFPSGEAFLAVCENLYNAFAAHRRNIVANTTCDCRACANVSGLDLKIIAHYGQFDEMQIGPMTDISGIDAILVHRMAKTDVKAATGIQSYALFSEAAVKVMDIDAALVPYSQSFEHFGDVPMKVYDLAAAWDSFRASHERHFLSEADGVFTYRHHFALPPRIVWEALVAPELKQRWMGMRSVGVDRPEGRIGPGSAYHCAHTDMDFRYWVTDWEPFDYFSTRINDPFNEGVSAQETYALTAIETGTELRYTMGPSLDAEGNHHPEAQTASVAFLAAFWPQAFDEMESLLRKAE
jgi:uncharacterized protein YndB with AHSA1/START domain